MAFCIWEDAIRNLQWENHNCEKQQLDQGGNAVSRRAVRAIRLSRIECLSRCNSLVAFGYGKVVPARKGGQALFSFLF
jgi:hypothetical protein